VTTSKGDILYVNDAVCNLFGYCYGELFEQNVKMLMPLDIANNHDACMRRYFTPTPSPCPYTQSEKPSSIVGEGRQLKGLHRNRTLLDIHLSVSAIKINNDTIFVATIQDISKFLALERVTTSMWGSLPKEIVEEIVSISPRYPRVSHFTAHDDVGIMFCDIVGFSTFCKIHTPHEIGDMLHKVFTILDDSVELYHLEKIRTIGDGYLITSGVFGGYSKHKNTTPVTNEPLLFAIKVSNECDKLDITLRIGIHLGNIISGIVGQKSNQFDLFGHDVNIAARLEQTCVPGHIHISDQFYDIVEDDMLTGSCKMQVTEMKNMGEINSWMVSRARFI